MASDMWREDGGPVTLVIKSPNLKFEDQEVRGASFSWTVRRLKTHLAQVYPSHPGENEQKLIYSGKLLLDHLQLKDVLRKGEDRHTLHLVCSNRNSQRSSEQPATIKVTETKEQPAPSASTHEVLTSTSVHGDGLRHRSDPQNLPPAQGTTVGDVGTDHQTPELTGFAAYTMYSPQQLFWLQQMYARQYYMQYQAAVAAAAITPPSTSFQQIPVVPPPAPPALPNQVPAVNLPVNQNVVPAQPNNPAGNQNLRMNAQGGPLMDEDEDVNRDWLDWMYTFARVSIFLSILYFYSSVGRFIMVMSTMILMYLQHVGWLPFRERPVPPEANQVPAAVENQEAADGEEETLGGASSTADEPEAPTYASTAWVFFKTFFASLIPEGPPAVAN
ncbi:homocysteine-responsive endoplasmic reticulum-resident ubiquitin-like domain member 1 protein [Latimeria chalumnae]|uniref:Homocysteine inducible ER protein with ubiquitin like domain 1 n=1 Tax=Latimeria chalumnae TaxID=7897 RepID=M3XKN1_LATCH|nr:PREDICTED: homocysteine-responsive endoplasmic reticulum-resident ubiquitin-like domain member 1 protein [Latimeria chalumnae]|eukprot:XP_006005687.1 PREDICTED: homocysteine-responsive endoplasmic reticulum-resident ubiquitin-like domain member 1 protein [Latimeria chalumnae]